MKITRLSAGAILVALCCLFGCKPARQQTQWIDPATLHASTVQHTQLSASQMQRVETLQQTFSEVDASPLDNWVDDFKRDSDPDREIRIMEGMAQAYKAYCSGKSLTLPVKKEVYQVVLLRSGATDSEVLSHAKLKILSTEDVKEILKHYEMAPAPIEVTTKPNG